MATMKLGTSQTPPTSSLETVLACRTARDTRARSASTLTQPIGALVAASSVALTWPRCEWLPRCGKDGVSQGGGGAGEPGGRVEATMHGARESMREGDIGWFEGLAATWRHSMAGLHSECRRAGASA